MLLCRVSTWVSQEGLWLQDHRPAPIPFSPFSSSASSLKFLGTCATAMMPGSCQDRRLLGSKSGRGSKNSLFVIGLVRAWAAQGFTPGAVMSPTRSWWGRQDWRGLEGAGVMLSF